MLTANDSDYQLFVFLVSYGNVPSLDKTLNRTSPHREDISSSGDKEKAVFHRIFDKEQKENNEKEIRAIISDYVDSYNSPIKIDNPDKYKEDFFDSYPFHPQLLQVVSNIYEGAKERQKLRGEMKLLAETVAENYEETDALLLSDLDERAFKPINRKLVNKFEIDKDKRLQDIDYAKDLLRVILIFSLEDSDTYPSKSDIFLGTFKPTTGMTMQQLDMSLQNMIGKAEYLHKENNLFSIRNERNIAALIESNKGDIDKDQAVEKIKQKVKKNICENQAYIYELEQDQIPDDGKSVEYVVCLNSYGGESNGLKEELEGFLDGREYQNNIVFVIPKGENTNLLENRSIVDKTKTLIAAENLKEKLEGRAEDINKRIEDEEKELKDRIENKYGSWVKWVGVASELNIRLKSTGLDIAEIKRKIRTDKERIREVINEILSDRKDDGIKIDTLVGDFKKMRKYPLLSDEEIFNTLLKRNNGEDWILIGDRGKEYWDDTPNKITGDMRVVGADYISRATEEEVEDLESKPEDEGDGFGDVDEEVVSEKAKLVKSRSDAHGNSFRTIQNKYGMSLNEDQVENINKLKLDIKLDSLSKEEFIEMLEELKSEKDFIEFIKSEIKFEEHED